MNIRTPSFSPWLMLAWLACLSANSLAQPASAQPAQGSLATEAADILQQLQPNSIVLIRLDVSQIKLPGKLDATDSGASKSSQWMDALRKNLDEFKAVHRDQPIYALVDLPFTFAQPPLRLYFSQSSASNQQLISDAVTAFDFQPLVEKDGWLMTSPGAKWLKVFSTFARESAIEYQQILNTPLNLPVPVDRFTQGFQSVENFPIQVVIVPPDYLWRTYEELLPELPEQLGGGPVSKLTQGFRSMAIGINPETMSLSAVVQSASSEAAREFAPLLPEIVSHIISSLPRPYQEGSRQVIADLASQMESEVVEDQIRYTHQPIADPQQAVIRWEKLMSPVVEQKIKLDEQRIKLDLRQSAIAIHNYESMYGTFPPAVKFRDSEGQSGLSWRVHILPLIEENELYQQFKLDEPWDSPHNKPLLEKMPKIFQTHSIRLNEAEKDVPTGYTTLVAPVGEGTLFGGNKTVTFENIADGTSNTIMFVEVKPEHAVPWTAPQDYKFDPANPGAGLKVGQNGKFVAAMGDASVQEIPADLPPQSIKHLFQMNDGKAVNW